MNKRNFLSVLLGVVFLAAGISKGYCQNYTSNYFTSGQPSLALPASFDVGTLTEDEKARWDTIVECIVIGTDDYCEEGEHFWYPTYYFKAADENELMNALKETYDTVYKQDGFIVWREFYDDEVYAIHLDSLIYEVRWYGDEDNPFFEEPGNNLWWVDRIMFKRVNGYIIPEKAISTYYDDEDLLPGILLEVTMTYTYLYYELIDEEGNTVVKTGDENLFNKCMGYTQIKEIQQADIKIYPNPAKEQITIDLPFDGDGNVDVKIFNMLGVNVLSQHHNKGGQINMDIHSLPAGVYVVRCVKDGKVISKRFVKQ